MNAVMKNTENPQRQFSRVIIFFHKRNVILTSTYPSGRAENNQIYKWISETKENVRIGKLILYHQIYHKTPFTRTKNKPTTTPRRASTRHPQSQWICHNPGRLIRRHQSWAEISNKRCTRKKYKRFPVWIVPFRDFPGKFAKWPLRWVGKCGVHRAKYTLHNL